MQKLYSYFLKRYLDQDFTEFSRAKLTLRFCLITSFFSFFYTIIANLIGFHVSAKVMPTLALLFFALAFLIRTVVSLNTVIFFYLALSYISSVLLMMKSGMIFSSITPWLAFIPMAANLLHGKKSALSWLVVCVITLFAVFYFSPERSSVVIAYNLEYDGFFYAVVNSGLVGIVLVLSMIYQKSKDRYVALLKEKNDLISEINKELKAKNDEIVAQNEELLQQKEEILSQREFIEMRNRELLKVQQELNNIIEKLTITQSELEIREAENRSILNAIYGTQLLVGELNFEGQLLKLNAALCEFFEQGEDDLRGKTFEEIRIQYHMKFSTDVDFFAILEKVKDGHHIAVEVPIKGDLKSYLLKINFFPIIDDKNEVTKVMMIAQDISELHRQKGEIEALNKELTGKIKEIETQNLQLISQRKEIEAINKEISKHNEEIKNINASLEIRVKKRTKNLEEKNRQLAEYAYINSHLLRGPLCSILGLVHLLASYPENDHEHVIEHLKKSTDELHKVVNKITQAIDEGTHFDRQLLSPN